MFPSEVIFTICDFCEYPDIYNYLSTSKSLHLYTNDVYIKRKKIEHAIKMLKDGLQESKKNNKYLVLELPSEDKTVNNILKKDIHLEKTFAVFKNLVDSNSPIDSFPEYLDFMCELSAYGLIVYKTYNYDLSTYNTFVKSVRYNHKSIVRYALWMLSDSPTIECKEYAFDILSYANNILKFSDVNTGELRKQFEGCSATRAGVTRPDETRSVSGESLRDSTNLVKQDSVNTNPLDLSYKSFRYFYSGHSGYGISGKINIKLIDDAKKYLKTDL